MSIKGDIFLGTLDAEIKVSPYGRKFSEDLKETSRNKRSANGTLKKDKLYAKKKFTFQYSIITGDAIEDYNTIYALPQPVSLKIFIENGVSQDYLVYMVPFKKKRMVLLDDGLWSGVVIQLEEK